MVADKRYYWGLDAMRGLAALAVVVGHLAHRYAPSAHLAVDFFFMLSGFVIAEAYGAKLAAGFGLWNLMLARLRRLYPLFAIGLVIGMVQILILMALGLRSVSWADLLISGVSNILFLPSPSYFLLPNPMRGLFPINGPAWSMFWEMLINFAFALFIFKLTTRWLAMMAGVAALGVIAAAVHHGDLNVGWDWPF